jgi:hypothetical protein
MTEQDVARAIACFEATEDVGFLRDVLRAIRPKAEAAALQAARRGKSPPQPQDIEPAREPATPAQAIATVRATKDFGLLQGMARAAGRRAEELAQQTDAGP